LTLNVALTTVLRTNVLHCDKYSNDIIQCCLDVAQSSIPNTFPGVISETIPGWNEYVAPAREKSIF